MRPKLKSGLYLPYSTPEKFWKMNYIVETLNLKPRWHIKEEYATLFPKLMCAKAKIDATHSFPSFLILTFLYHNLKIIFQKICAII